MGPYSSLPPAGLPICWGGNSATRASAFFKHIFLSTADKLDISVSGGHLETECSQFVYSVKSGLWTMRLSAHWPRCDSVRIQGWTKQALSQKCNLERCCQALPPFGHWERSKQLRWGLALNTANSFYSKYTKVSFVESSETFVSLILVWVITLDKNGAPRKMDSETEIYNLNSFLFN